MQNKNKKQIRSKKGLLLSTIIVGSLIFAGCTGNHKEETKKEPMTQQTDTTTNIDSTKNEEAVKESTKEEIKDTDYTTANSTTKEESTTKEDEKTSAESKNNTHLDKYVKLLGLNKNELAKELNEEPQTVDEGGLEFKNAGIRVWFDQTNYEVVEQIFVMNPDFEISGAKIGDKISKFSEVLDKPIRDNNGDAHYKYNDVYILVNYDTTTQDTYAVYILKNDF